MSFTLFLIVHAVLFIRPSELLPQLGGLPLYNASMLACIVCTLPVLARRLTLRSLMAQPITMCILGVLAAVVVSNLANALLPKVFQASTEFLKVVIYYLLFISLVTSVRRLRSFLLWFTLLAVGLVLLPVLHFHGKVDLPTLEVLQDVDGDGNTGTLGTIARLQATGIFRDPNDLSLIIVIGILVALYWLGDRRHGSLRWLWLAPLGLFGHALALTHSRGGLLALVTGLMVFSNIRFGWRKTVLGALCGLPLLLVVFGPRQTNLSTTDGTGQERIRIWSDGILLFRSHPLFGIGTDRYAEEVGYVCHNSFLHGFAEMGFFGGMFFLGAFYLAIWMLYRMSSRRRWIVDPDLDRLYPTMAAVLAAYIVGMFSLSLTYVVPTYMILALVTVYQRLTAVDPPLKPLRFNGFVLQRMALASVSFLALMYVFVRVSVRWS